MSYQVRSTDVWFNLPGVVAAYQPVACPGGPLAARVNVANEQRTPGRYMATPGVAPTWNSTDGWTGDGTRYLTTGISPSNTWSYIARISSVTASAPFGSRAGIGNQEVWIVPASGANSLWSNGARTTAGTTYPTGIVAIADRSRYFNGSFIASDIPAQTFTSTYPLLLCAWSNAGTPNGFTGNIQAIAIYNTTLNAPQVWLASRQMAYCHVNPDWSAWGRRRRYYYAPAAAASAAKMNTYFRRMRS